MTVTIKYMNIIINMITILFISLIVIIDNSEVLRKPMPLLMLIAHTLQLWIKMHLIRRPAAQYL